MPHLTHRQRQALSFIENHLQEYGFQPSMEEIAAALGLRQPTGAIVHLHALEKKGVIKMTGKPRGLQLLKHKVQLIAVA
jgi:repressor LexA